MYIYIYIYIYIKYKHVSQPRPTKNLNSVNKAIDIYSGLKKQQQ